MNGWINKSNNSQRVDRRKHCLPDVLVERQTLDPQRTWPRLAKENAVAFSVMDGIGNRKCEAWLW